jgi:hypothetical protein
MRFGTGFEQFQPILHVNEIKFWKEVRKEEKNIKIFWI